MIRQFAFLLSATLVISPMARLPRRVSHGTQDTSATQGSAADPVVVRVLGESITEKQVMDAITQLAIQMLSNQQATPDQMTQKDTLYYKDALDTLIGAILLKDEAKAKGLVVDKAKADATFQSYRSKFQSEEMFQQALKVQGRSEADLRTSIATNLLCQQVLDLIAQGVPPPTDGDLQKYYDDNPKSFDQPEQMHAAAICLKVEKGATPEQKAKIRSRIEAIRADIESSRITFADAAIKNSDDKVTGPKGGDLGFFKRGAMIKQLEDVAFATKPGTLTPIIESDPGYFLIRVIEVKPAGKMPFDEAKPKIKDFLVRKAVQEATKKHLAELKAKVKIEVIMTDEEWAKRHAAK